MVVSAGLIIIKDQKVLLVKPKGSPDDGQYSFPKGIVEPGEEIIDAAIRETLEEVGIKIDRGQVSDETFCIKYVNDGIATKRAFCFVVRLDNSSIPDIIPTHQLQVEEVEHAAFYTRKEAMFLLFWRYRHILWEINGLK